MATRDNERRSVGSGWRSAAALVVVALSLASCSTTQVVEPPPTGTVWTRLTPGSYDNCLFPDVRFDSLVYSALAYVPVGRDTITNRTIFGYRQRIAVSGIDGANPVRLLYGGAADWNDFYPRWSGRQRIVFVGNRNPQNYEIWHKDLETFNESRLAPFPTNEAAPAPRPGTSGIAYVELLPTATSIFDYGRIVLIPDTTAHPAARIYLTPDTLLCGDPDWDPTGGKLCFSVQNNSDLTRHVVTMNLAAGDTLPVPITTGPFHDLHPRWSPDGGRIAFVSDRTGRSGVWAVSSEGEAKGLKLVSFDDAGALVFTPAWTADGTGLIVSSDGRGSVRSLWLITNLPAFGF